MSQTKKFLLLVADAALLYGALALTLMLRYRGVDFGARWHDHLVPFSALFLVWLLTFWLFDFYRQRAFVNYNAVANRVMVAVGIAVLTSIVLFYLFQGFFRLTPKTNLVIFALIVAIGEYCFRSTFLALARFRPQPAVIIGTSPEVQELVEFLKKHPHAGYHATAWLTGIEPGNSRNLAETVKRAGARTLIVQPALTKDPSVIRSLYDLLPLGVNIVNFADFYELVFERVPLDELEEGWFIEHVATNRPGYDRAKRVVDFVAALVLSILLLPFMLLAAVLIKLTSKGPVIFVQKRMGRNDMIFRLYKFRTMTTWNGGNDGTPAWTEKNDSRITAVGRFLRAAHIDEFPQLWNILRGDISFTGPRPERVELAEEFRKLPYYNIRHVVKPGLTGWAQINFRPSASLEEGKEKLKYDIYYVKNRSFLLDLAIFLKTIKYFFAKAE